MAIVLTDLDERILWTLTRKIRLVTLDQAARTWWSSSPRPLAAAKSRLRRLSSDGLVRLVSVMAHPEIKLVAPVFSWAPGDKDPPFGRIAYQLQVRWRRPLVATPIVIATKEALRRFGGYIGDRLPRPAEVSHDVNLSSVYLQLLADDPARARFWVSEHQLYAEGGGRNERLPDAILRSARNRPDGNLIIEFGGAYTKSKLQQFHSEFSAFRYEVW